MSPSLDRRSLLGSMAAVGLAGSAGAFAVESEPVGEARVASEAVDGTAADWTRRAMWQSAGVATEFPLQVMYPADTVRSMDALAAHDSLDGAAVRTAAENAARLQGARTGGFYSFAGDFLGPWTQATYGAVALSNRTGVDIDRSAAADFLEAMQLDSGGFAPRYNFFGTSPIAVRTGSTADALWGLQYLNALDDEVRNQAVSFLQREQTPQGGWAYFGSTVEPSTLGTYHALRALDAVDADTRRNREEAAAYLASMQADGGGFYAGDSPISCKPGCMDEPGGGIILAEAGSDDCDRERDPDPWTCDDDQQVVTTYSTSRAILGLARTGHLGDVENLQQHADWLANRQVWDPDDPRFVGAFSDREGPSFFYFPRNTTRLALRALAVLEANGVTPDVEVDVGAAVDLLERCRHPGTGGFGAWPNYVQSLRATAPAVRSLRDLGEDVPGEELAATLAATQARTYERDRQQDGAIPPQGWKWTVDTTQTASALLALSHAGHFGAVDVAAAAGVLASRQDPDSGGFKPSRSPYARADVRSTGMAVLALDAVAGADRVDRDALARYYAAQQDDGGHVGDARAGYVRIADTSLSLRATAALGVAERALDVDGAAEYLAGLAAEDGEYWPHPSKAGQAVMGLAAVDGLDRIDADATREYLETNQLPSGGFSGRAFFNGYTALHRHAAGVSGLRLLGGTPDAGDTAESGGFAPAPDVERASGVATLSPGRGMVNHRAVLVDPDDLAE